MHGGSESSISLGVTTSALLTLTTRPTSVRSWLNCCRLLLHQRGRECGGSSDGHPPSRTLVVRRDDGGMGESGQPDEAQFVAMVKEQFDQVRPAIDALLDEIDRFLDQVEEPIDVASGRPPYRLIVAAGLRRCTRLTRAQLALIDSGLADIGDLPTCPALETFLVAAYVFLAGDEGLDGVRRRHVGRSGGSTIRPWSGPRSTLSTGRSDGPGSHQTVQPRGPGPLRRRGNK